MACEKNCGSEIIMIENDEQLTRAQQAIVNLQKILLEARKIHSAEEYRAMSEQILLEIQQREHEIIAYLSKKKTEITVV
ncbi:MAG: hypothetical protein XU11_C0010G0029 [Candidatus Dadabacteria bacterium CSP1-2]|nr:MAG: hypothetical protein XU11_C0010G0029 [Candidatus Dadabacteria bacterium CSP1-2]MBF8302769.1 hypothetical protein [Candidatus Dadabacteria bacterium]HJZ05599.1 hypothetical protein [Patescibacteria group bacterium]